MEAELESNFELHVADNVRAGMSEAEARRTARLRYGSITSAREAYRERKSLPLLESIGRDLRFSIRALSKDKTFTFAATATLALCLGGNAAVFAALYDFVLRPVPFPDSERLYRVVNHEENGARLSNSSWSQYLDFKQNADLFEGFAFLYQVHKPMVRADGADLVAGQSVSADLFDVLEVTPLLGRFFAEEENLPGAHRVVVLPQTVWEREYDAQPGVLGREIHFSGEAPYTIIGVAPRAVEVFDSKTEFFIPFVASQERFEVQDRYLWPIDLWGRLKEGVAQDAALAQLKALDRRWLQEVANPERRARNEGRIGQISLTRRAPLRSQLLLLQCGGLLLLAVGCINVLNLFLIRSGRRRKEFDVRRSLGASRWVLARLMLTESFLLAGAATACGAFLASNGIAALNYYLPIVAPAAQPVVLSGPIWTSLIAGGFGLAVVLGAVPIAHLWRKYGVEPMRPAARAATADASTASLNGWLLVGQVAVAFVLLVGAGLLTRSLANVLAVDPGFDTQRVVRGRLSLRGIYARNEIVPLRNRIVSALREIPGVEQVAWAAFESFVLDHRRHPFYLRARPQNAGAGHVMLRQVVSPEYFKTMGIPLIEGRLPAGPGQGWVVDSSFQDRYFPGETAIGAELYYQPQGPDAGGPWPRVVGVVGRANFEGLARRDGPPVVYDVGAESPGYAWDFTVLLRTSRAASGVVQDLRAKLNEVDPSLPLSRVGTLEDALEGLHMDRHGVAALSGAFAGMALLLAAIGVFSVLSYSVEQRTQEIGVRVALGGAPLQILSLVLRHGFLRAAAGMAVGAVSAYWLARLLQNQLFDVTAQDTASYCAAAGLLFLAIAIASYLPARDALQVDPVESFRGE